MDLKQIPVTDVKGIGDKTASLLSKLNVNNVEDLIRFYPRNYIKYLKPKKISELKAGEVAAIKVTVMRDFYTRKTAKMSVSTVTVKDTSGACGLTFFRMDFLRNVFKAGTEFVIYGMVKTHGSKFVFEQPKYFKPDEYEDMLKTLQPVYPLTKGLSKATITKAVLKALAEYPVEDTIDPKIIEKYKFKDLEFALKNIHYPKDEASFIQARRRLVFDEFFHFFKTIKEMKDENNKKPSNFTMIDVAETSRLIEVLPYELTGAQIRAFESISEDLTSGYVMNRLIQGDVGSGKTIVAFLSMLMSSANGYQSCLMAPTEVLATQHYNELMALKDKYKLNINPVLLTGAVTAAEKKKRVALLKSGESDIAIGTHALFQDKIEFNKLALVITDEEHRFGVRQRDKLADKGDNPHVLVMSATPIPRTIANSVYGDLDISIMDEMPAKRLPIKSCVVGKDKRDTSYNFIIKEINSGHQAYVICPMVEESEMVDIENVIDYAALLKDKMPAGINIEVLHGKMKPAEKNRIMNDFAAKNIDILVSTTVIEVGINVPNATVIMIENAERFGLAQLHQLRGRVGRGDAQSYCIFIDGALNENSQERLGVLIKSNDGFFIANEDLRLRGPGDILGIRQSGEMLFKIGDIYQDNDILQIASTAAML